MDWRSWSRREKALLRDLALMLAVMLVVGVYFLERLDTRLQTQQRQHLQALAGYLAEDSAEYLSAGNHLSLGVIARQAAGLDTVATLVVRDMRGRELARSGPEQSRPAPVQQAAEGENGPVGRVEVWPAADRPARGGVESGFVLVVLLLLALRILGEIIRRQLGAGGRSPESVDEPDAMAQPESAGLPRARVGLYIEPDRLASLRERYTRSALKARLAEHERLLDRVVSLYGGVREMPLNEGGRVVFAAARPSEAAFQALCAARVFLQAAQRLETTGDKRAPAFRILLSAEDGARVCLPEHANTGVIYVPADELDELELDQCALYRYEDRLDASPGTGDVSLQPIARLVQRYQHLIATQADRLVAGLAES